MMSEPATSVQHVSEEPAWESHDTSAEKLRVLEGFHRWVMSKAASIESPNDDPVTLRQILVEIVGAAGFATALLSSKK